MLSEEIKNGSNNKTGRRNSFPGTKSKSVHPKGGTHSAGNSPASGNKNRRLSEKKVEDLTADKPLQFLTDEKEIVAYGYAPLAAHIEGTSATNTVDLRSWGHRRTRITKVMKKNLECFDDIEDNYNYVECFTHTPKDSPLNEATINTLSSPDTEEKTRNAVFREFRKEIRPLKQNAKGMFKLENKLQQDGERADFTFAILLSEKGEPQLFVSPSNHIFTAGMMPFVVAAGDGFIVDSKEDVNKKRIVVNERTGAYYKPSKEEFYEKDGVKINYNDSFLRAVETCFGKGVERLKEMLTPKQKEEEERKKLLSLKQSGIVQTNIYVERQAREQEPAQFSSIAEHAQEKTVVNDSIQTFSGSR